MTTVDSSLPKTQTAPSLRKRLVNIARALIKPLYGLYELRLEREVRCGGAECGKRKFTAGHLVSSESCSECTHPSPAPPAVAPSNGIISP